MMSQISISRNARNYPDHVVSDFIRDLSKLDGLENLKVTVNSSIRGGVITGSCATVGGLIIGPVGLAIGSIIGGVASALMYKDQFKSVSQLLQEMNTVNKNKLFEAVMNKLQNIGTESILPLARLLLQQDSLKQIVLQVVKEFVEHELQYNVI